jgi:hypothetical protein
VSRRRSTLAVLAALGALAAAACATAATTATAASPVHCATAAQRHRHPKTCAARRRPPARLQVVAREFTLTVSRGSLPAGGVIAELVNRGEDGHDLRVRRAGGGDRVAIDEIRPGAVADSPAKLLTRGAYVVYCSLPGHEAAGMRVALTVR